MTDLNRLTKTNNEFAERQAAQRNADRNPPPVVPTWGRAWRNKVNSETVPYFEIGSEVTGRFAVRIINPRRQP